jgi:hypothetical protein
VSEIDLMTAPFLFFVHNRNHVRLFTPVAERLRTLGWTVTFVDLEAWHFHEGAVPELRRLGFSSISIEELAKSPPSRGVFVLGNDWAPAAFTKFLNQPGRNSIKLVGIVDGCRFALPDRYTRVDYVLGWGPSSRSCFKRTVIVTGSPIIEAASARQVYYSDPPLVAVNYKFTYGHTDRGARYWGASVMRACEKAELPFAFSAHPSNRVAGPVAMNYIDRAVSWGASVILACERAGLPARSLTSAAMNARKRAGSSFVFGPRPSNREAHRLPIENIDMLLDRASVLVTRPSTVAYEAMARGTPVVLFPMPGEPLAEFAQPMGAFEATYDVGALSDLISSALLSRDGYKAQCRRFLDSHVEIGTPGTAIARTASALATIAAEV